MRCLMLNFFNIDWKSLQDGIFIFSGFNQCSVGEVILYFYIFCMLGLFIKKSSNRVVFLIILIISFFMVFILGFAEVFNIDNYVSVGDNNYHSVTPKSSDDSITTPSSGVGDSIDVKCKDNENHGPVGKDSKSEKNYVKYQKAILYGFCITLGVGLVCGLVVAFLIPEEEGENIKYINW